MKLILLSCIYRYVWIIVLLLVLPAHAAETDGSDGPSVTGSAGQPAGKSTTTPAPVKSKPVNRGYSRRIKRLEAQLKWARAALKRERKKNAALRKELSAQATRPIAVIDSEYSDKPVVLTGKGAKTETPNSSRYWGRWGHLLWLGISFAMLVIGFISGAVWWRVRHRKRLGGMDLRI